jgi:hypothetical protein
MAVDWQEPDCPVQSRFPASGGIEVRCWRSNRTASTAASTSLLNRKRPASAALSARSVRHVSTPCSSGCARTAVATWWSGQSDRRRYWSSTRPVQNACANRLTSCNTRNGCQRDRVDAPSIDGTDDSTQRKAGRRSRAASASATKRRTSSPAGTSSVMPPTP